MYSQTRRLPYRFPSAVDYISNHGFRVIHNIRKNYLRVLLSRERSRGSGIYHTSQKVSYDKQPIDIGSLINNLQHMKNEDDTWKKKFGGLPYMAVDYEKLVLNPEIQTNQVLSFLGVEKQEKLSTDFVRLSPESIDNLVSNYEEVCSILAGTEFEYCIIEDGK